jgi:hypothetical protein
MVTATLPVLLPQLLLGQELLPMGPLQAAKLIEARRRETSSALLQFMEYPTTG